MTKTELDRLPMYRVLKAIIDLRAGKHLATTTRIAPLTDRTTNNISHILTYLWDWGYVQRKNIRKRKTSKYVGAVKRDTSGCVYHYKLTKKGQSKYQKLMFRFGKLDAQQPKSGLILPSDTINIPEQPAEESKPPAS